jgi:hypothetical protein
MEHYFFSYLLTCEVYLIEVLENMAEMLQNIYLFKPESNKGEFRLYFEFFGKSCRGRHHSEISKTNAETLISAIWIRLHVFQGCQKMRQNPLNMPLEVWCANSAPNLKNIQKSLEKQVFFDIFFQF